MSIFIVVVGFRIIVIVIFLLRFIVCFVGLIYRILDYLFSFMITGFYECIKDTIVRDVVFTRIFIISDECNLVKFMLIFVKGGYWIILFILIMITNFISSFCLIESLIVNLLFIVICFLMFVLYLGGIF
jgi:hypothetical protein